MKVSHSQLNAFNTCPALYYWGYVKRIKPINPNYDLMYGGSIHEALASYFKHLQRSDEPKVATKYMQAIEESIAPEGYLGPDIVIDREEPIIGYEGALSAAKETWKSEWVKHNLASYEHKSKSLTAGMKFIDKVAALELEKRGRIVLVEEMQEKKLTKDIIYRVKLDLLLESPEGVQTVIDFKTKGRLNTNYFYLSALDRQMKGYAWGANGTKPVDNNIIILHCVKLPMVYENQQSFTQNEIDLWLEETISICGIIQTNLSLMKKDKINANICFPRCSTSCQIYGCWAADLCMQGRLDEAQIDPGRYVSKDCEHGIDLQESCDECGRDQRKVKDFQKPVKEKKDVVGKKIDFLSKKLVAVKRPTNITNP